MLKWEIQGNVLVFCWHFIKFGWPQYCGLNGLFTDLIQQQTSYILIKNPNKYAKWQKKLHNPVIVFSIIVLI